MRQSYESIYWGILPSQGIKNCFALRKEGHGNR